MDLDGCVRVTKTKLAIFELLAKLNDSGRRELIESLIGAGTPAVRPAARRTERRLPRRSVTMTQAIEAALRATGAPMSVVDIAKAVKVRVSSSLRGTLWNLRKDGRIVYHPVSRTHTLPDEAALPVSGSHVVAIAGRQKKHHNHTETRGDAVLRLLRERGPLTSRALSQALTDDSEAARNSVRVTLYGMRSSGRVFYDARTQTFSAPPAEVANA